MNRCKSLERFCSAVVLCLLFFSCKSVKETVEVPVYIHDTTVSVKEVHDSTFIDRWHTIEVKGDTVYWHDSVVFVKYHVKTDTAYKYVEVPVTVTKTETVEVEKPLSWWRKTQIYGFRILLAALLIYLAYKTKKWWLPLLVKK